MQHDFARQRDGASHEGSAGHDASAGGAVGKHASHYDQYNHLEVEEIEHSEEELADAHDDELEERAAAPKREAGQESDHADRFYRGRTQRRRITSKIRFKTGLVIKNAVGTGTVSAVHRWNRKLGRAAFEKNSWQQYCKTDKTDSFLGYELEPDGGPWFDYKERDGHSHGLRVLRYGVKITSQPLKLPFGKTTQKHFVHWLAGKYTGKSKGGSYKR